MKEVREPTGDECEKRAYLPDCDGYACWYPQMGGYHAKCVVILGIIYLTKRIRSSNTRRATGRRLGDDFNGV